MCLRNRSEGGFSLLELLIVISLTIVVAAMAIPSIVNSVANIRLRGGMNTLSGLYQECRSSAVRDNKLMSAKFASLGSGPLVYVKDATLSGTAAAVVSSDPQVMLGSPMTRVTSIGTYPGAPTAIDSTVLGYTPATGDPDLTFNPRGLPCVYSSGSCLTQNGFAFYFTDQRPFNKNAWAAVTVSPAGRVKVWMWTGSAWSN